LQKANNTLQMNDVKNFDYLLKNALNKKRKRFELKIKTHFFKLKRQEMA